MRIIAITLLMCSLAFAAGETGFEFLEADKTTYSLAKNSNDILSSNPVTGIFANPTSLSYLKQNNLVNTNFSMQFIDSKNVSFIYGRSINKVQKAGIGIAINDYGTFTETSEKDPYGNGTTFSASELLLQGTYSHKILEELVVAAAPIFIYQKYYDYSAYAMAINIGATYYLDSYKVSVVGKNLGAQLKTLLENEEKNSLPYTAGIAFGNLSKERFNWEFDIVKIYHQKMKFGFSNSYRMTRMFSLLSGITLTSENLNYIFGDKENTEYYFDESRLISAGLEFNHKNIGFIFALGYVGTNFTPNTSFSLDYKF